MFLSELDDPEGGDFERDVELQGQDIEDQYDACWLFNQDSGDYEQLQDFMPSRKFNGAKPGWAFKLGAHGCGYYRDCEPIAVSQQRPGRTVLQLDSLLSCPSHSACVVFPVSQDQTTKGGRVFPD